MAADDVPEKIGRYSIDRLLGAGAMGFVYLGRDPELDRPVAIKTVRNLEMEPDTLRLFLERFRNEARAAARLQHPHIVQVYDVGEEPSIGPYLVFEYVAGSTLKQMLKAKGALAPTAVVRLAEEIGDALTLAHEAGIIHRDIKPDNLLITPDGQAKLADFGIARMPNAALTREGQFLGTPCYAAPETLAEGDYSVRSDLFSFAAVLYEAASGKRAFPGDDALSVAHKVIHDEPASPASVADDPASIPGAVEHILLEGLSKTAAGRRETAAELATTLREAYEESGLVRPEDLGRPPSRRIRVAKPSADEGGKGGLALVLAVVLTLGVALIFLFRDVGDPVILAPVDMGVDTTAQTADMGVLDESVDVAPDVALVDSVPADAGPGEDAGPEDAGDAGADGEQPDLGEVEMTPHEREEAAKDALDRARALVIDGDIEGAHAALAEAQRLDPGNPDIAELEAELPQ